MEANDEKYLRLYVAEQQANGHATSVHKYQMLLDEIDSLRDRLKNSTPIKVEA
jgi:hypothetical protein